MSETETSPGYEARMDALFAPQKAAWTHRTLRTLFDKGSMEWEQTDMPEKLRILERIIREDRLNLVLIEYRIRYRDRRYIIDALPDALGELLVSMAGLCYMQGE